MDNNVKLNPNHFDPYEALDIIENITLESRDTRVILGGGDLGVIQRKVYALRAYITGRNDAQPR